MFLYILIKKFFNNIILKFKINNNKISKKNNT